MFRHPLFLRGRFDLLPGIKRKEAGKKKEVRCAVDPMCSRLITCSVATTRRTTAMCRP